MDVRRVCIHEAGHFYLAFKYRPARAVSICISKQVQIDSHTGDECKCQSKHTVDKLNP